MFLSLAPELIKEIGSEMDIQDIKSLRLTCKASSETLAAHVLSSVTISISKSTLDQDIYKLRRLATTSCATAYATRRLIIKSLSPSYHPRKMIGGSDTDEPSDTPVDKGPRPSAESLLVEEEMKKFLFAALSSFQNVQTVSWQPISEDKTWMQTTVMEALRTLTSITSLYIDISWCRLEVPFHWFTGLQEISTSGTGGEYHNGTFENLARMVAQSPQLNSIKMKSTLRFRVPLDKSQSLHQLFQYYPKDAPPLRLRTLLLDTCLLRLDNITIPHLKHLTSLTIKNIKDTSESRPVWSIPESEEVEAEQKRWGSNLQEIWSVILKANIFLEEITVDVVPPALVTYLSSYSGLKTLKLATDGREHSDYLANQFYSKSLANHVQSLRILGIQAIYEGSWCVGDHNLSLISQCINLERLDVSVIASQVDLDPADGSPSGGPDIVKRIIDMAATSMPQLDALSMSPAAPECERDAPCGNYTMAHYSYTYKRIVASIDTYQALPSHRRLPSVLIGPKHFFECQSSGDNGGKLLRYMPSPNNPPFDYDWW